MLKSIFLITIESKKELYGVTANEHSAIQPNVYMGLLGSYAKSKGVPVEMLDETSNLDMDDKIQVLLKYKPVLVGVVCSGANPSSSTMSMVGAIKFFKKFNPVKGNIKTFICGGHPTVLSEQTIEETGVDFVIKGEGYNTIVNLYNNILCNKHPSHMNRAQANKDFEGVVCKNRNDYFMTGIPPLIDVNNLPMLDWYNMNPKKYRAHNWHCVDSETEVLTEDGWKLIKDIVDNKQKIKIATLNPDKNIVEYHYPQKYIKRKNNENMIEVNSRFLNFRVTKDHNLLVSKWKNTNFSFIKANNLNNNYKNGSYFINRNIPNNNKDINFFKLPLLKDRKCKIIKNKLLMDDFLKLLGLYLSEGTCGNKKIVISQVIPKQRKIIHSIIDSLGYNVNSSNYDRGLEIHNIQLTEYFRQFGLSDEKYIPRELLNNLSKRQAKILLEYLMFGDGSWFKYMLRGYYCTTSKQLADDVQELAFKSGFGASLKKITKFHKSHYGKKPMYYVNIHQNQITSIKKNSIKNSKNKDSFVYCLTVPNHTLFIRRKGKCHWTGNCFGDIENRSPYGVIWSSFGCPYACSFCCINNLFGQRKYRLRNIQGVLKEIDILVKKHGVKHIKILDELFIIENKRIDEFIEGLEKRNYDLNMWAYARMDTVTPELLQRLKKVGLNWVAYGMESVSQNVLTNVQKGYNRNFYEEVIQMTKDAGMYICADFIAGLWEDNIETMQETYDFAVEQNFEWLNLYPAFTYPGTPMCTKYVKEGRIKNPKNWGEYALYGYDCKPAPTKTLTSAQVLKWRDEKFISYHSRPEYLSMIETKFGEKTKQHIIDMISLPPLKRKILEKL